MIHLIQYRDDPVLGNLALNFLKQDGEYNTIVFAGENGCGKTSILETLSKFLNLEGMLPIEEIKYKIDDDLFKINTLGPRFAEGFHRRTNLSTGRVETIQKNRWMDKNSIDKYDIRHYGFSYSKSRSGFKTSPIKTTTTKDVDKEKYEADATDNFTQIKQLLIDIKQRDNSDWAHLSSHGTEMSYEEFIKKSSRIYRFTSAFDNFFDQKIKFWGYDTKDDNELQVFFEKHGKKIPIDQLSTGEMQIVFRGAHLLKNAQSIKGGIVLIDEPELSLHPKWQRKILKFYRDLFTQNGQQTVQIFIATHSQYVIESALNDSDNVLVVALKDDNGNIISQNMSLPVALPNPRASEINYHIFGIETEEYHIELYGYLQYKNSLLTVKDTDDFIKLHPKYDTAKHHKQYIYTRNNGSNTTYETLPTYIRNAIDHPDGRTYTQEELATSIKLLIELCK